MSAGKDDAGVERIYKTDRDIVLNKATAVEFKNINNPYVTSLPAEAFKHELYASPIANSQDGIGEALDSAAPEWDTFGNKEVDNQRQRELDDADRTMPSAEVGFAIGSPILHLAEGDRTISVRLNFSQDSDLSQIELIEVADLFTFGLSTEEDWLMPEIQTTEAPTEGEGEGSEPAGSTGVDPPGKAISFDLFLDGTEPAIIPFDSEVLDGEFVTKYPMLRAILNTVYYQTFTSLKLENIELSVNVAGVRNLVIQSDLARLNPSKPFMPFGPKPKVNSNFYIGSEEVFYKKLSEVSINMDWGDLPESMVEYYHKYSDNVESVPDEVSTLKNSSFKVNFKLYKDRAWLEPNKWADETGGDIDSAIFATDDDEVVADGKKTIVIKLQEQEDFEPIKITGDNPAYGIDTINGFLRMELQNFDFYGPESADLETSELELQRLRIWT